MSSLLSLVSYADQSDEDEQDEDLPVKQQGKDKANAVEDMIDLDEELRMPETAWQQVHDPKTGYPYYWNIQTNEITWEPPQTYLDYLSALSDYAVKVELRKEAERKRKEKKKQARKEAKAKKEGAITLISSYGGETSEESESEESSADARGPPSKPVEYGPSGPPPSLVEYGPAGPPEELVEYGPAAPPLEPEYGPSVALEKVHPITPLPDVLTSEESADVALGPVAPPTPEIVTSKESDTEPPSKSASTISELKADEETTVDSVVSEVSAVGGKAATFFIGDKSDEDDLMSILESEKPPDYEAEKLERLKSESPMISEATPVPSSDDLMELLESEKPPDYTETPVGSPKPGIQHAMESSDDLLSAVLAEEPPDYADNTQDSMDVLDLIKNEVPPDDTDDVKPKPALAEGDELKPKSEISEAEVVKPSYDDLLAEFYEELESDLKGVKEESEAKGEKSVLKLEKSESAVTPEASLPEPPGKEVQKSADDDLLAQFYAELESEGVTPSESPKPPPVEPPPPPPPPVVKQPPVKKKMSKAESRELMKVAKSTFSSVGALPVLAEPEDVEKTWDFSQVAVGEASSDSLGQYQGGHRGFGFHGIETTPYVKKGFVKFSKGETLEPIAAGVFEVVEPPPPEPKEVVQPPVASAQVETASQTDEKVEKLLDPNLTSVLEDLVERLVFLEVEKVKVDPLKILALQADTLFSAWQEGALQPSYLQHWLDKSLSVMERYEKYCVAPQGWSATWESTNRRYVYQNTTTGEVQYIKPEVKKEEKTPAKPKAEKPARVSDVAKIPTPGSSTGSRTVTKPKKRKPSPAPSSPDVLVLSPPPPPGVDLPSSPVPPPPAISPPSPPSTYSPAPPPPPVIYVAPPIKPPPPPSIGTEEPSGSGERERERRERDHGRKASGPASKKARTSDSKSKKKPSAFKMMSKWQDIQNQFK